MMPCAEDLGVVPDCAVKVLGEFGIPGMDVQRWRRDWENSFLFLEPETYRPVSIALSSTHDMGAFKNWWEEEVGTVDEERFKRGCEDQGLDFENLKGILFETASCGAGRLRWKREMTSYEKVLERAKLSADQAWIFKDYYSSAFHEREQFWQYLGPAAPKGPPSECSTPELVLAALRRANEAQSIFAIQMFSDLLSIAPEIHDQSDRMKINWPGTFGEQNWSARMPLALEALIHKPFNPVLKSMHQETGRI